jgi:hypothetical protein
MNGHVIEYVEREFIPPKRHWTNVVFLARYLFYSLHSRQISVALHDGIHRHVGVDVVDLEEVRNPIVRAMCRVCSHLCVDIHKERCAMGVERGKCRKVVNGDRCCRADNAFQRQPNNTTRTLEMKRICEADHQLEKAVAQSGTLKPPYTMCVDVQRCGMSEWNGGTNIACFDALDT